MGDLKTPKFQSEINCPLITKQLTKGREEGSKITEIETTSFMNGPKKECQTTHHPECKKIPHTVYVEKCDVNTEQKCETVYESVQDENCNTVYDTKCHTSYLQKPPENCYGEKHCQVQNPCHFNLQNILLLIDYLVG